MADPNDWPLPPSNPDKTKVFAHPAGSVLSRFPFHLRIIVMSKNRSALKIFAEIILMIVIFGIAMLFTNRGNINDKKPLTEQPSPNSTSSSLDET